MSLLHPRFVRRRPRTPDRARVHRASARPLGTIGPISVVRNSNGSWTVSWTGGQAPYSIWLDGKLVATTSSLTYTYVGGEYSDDSQGAPPFEIVSNGDVAQSWNYPPYAIIQWRGLATATAYAVEQYIDAAWIEIGQVMETQRGYYTWVSDLLTDEQTHQFRVIALDNVGNEGTALAFSIDMVRNPAPPSVALSFNTAGDLVVASG